MTQNERIIEYLNNYGSITPLEAFADLGVMRLAARIDELIKSGYPIEKKMETAKNRFGESVSYMRYRKAV